MKTSIVIKHFESQVAIARALGISRQAVSKWGEVVPWAAALEIQHITGGVLKRDERLYDNRKAKS